MTHYDKCDPSKKADRHVYRQRLDVQTVVVPALVNFVNGCCVDWWKLGLDADGLVNRTGSSASVGLDDLFSVGLSSLDAGKWRTTRCNAASR
jgi:hypothetical protein